MVINGNMDFHEFQHWQFVFVLQSLNGASIMNYFRMHGFAIICILLGTIALIISAIFLYQYLRRRWQELQARIQLVCTSGYLPEPPTDSDDRIMRKVSRFAVWLQIGSVRWSGLDNLECPTPRLVVPTHGHYLDPFVLAGQMPTRARVMAARGLFKAGGGLGGLLFSRWGAFCTDLDPGKGLSALRTAVKVLASGESLVIFPEGWAHMDGKVGPFNPGVASIVQLASNRIQRPVNIIPVYIHYGKYPGEWINSFSTGIQCLILMVGFIRYRRGVHVVFGKPILSSDLPPSPHAAAEQIRTAVLASKPLSISGMAEN